MANYAINPEILEPHLPNGVELDFYKDETYVSLVGLMFNKTSLFGMPIPFLGTFEEVNLRFYVKQTEGDRVKRGVVFINETVPYKLVAWVANKLYREHYISIPTKNKIGSKDHSKQIEYAWKMQERWNHLDLHTAHQKEAMASGSV